VFSHLAADRERLAELADEQAALRRIATLVARRVPAAQIFNAVAEEVGPLVGAEIAAIQSYEPDGYTTLLGSWGKLPDRFPIGRRWKLEGDNVTTLVYRTERPARLDRYENATGSVPAEVREAGVHSVVASPIIVDGHLWGVIVAATSRAESMPVDAESRIAQFTELVATAISNIQARFEVERLAEEQAALRRVAMTVARGRPPEEVFAQVAQEAGQLLGVEGAVIHRFEADGYVTVVASWAKMAGDAFPLGRRSKLEGDSATALVYRTGRSARLDDFENASGSIAAHARKAELRSGVASPIVVNGRLWGAIGAATSRAEPLPSDTESRIAQFTELVATAIANVQARSDLATSRARIVATADEERRRVVRDLHDGAQQHLVLTIMTLKLARDKLELDGQDAALVNEALKQAQTATGELRELARGILPSALTHGGLRAGVRALVSRTSIPVEIDISAERFPAAVEATAYFIVAEALTNIAKHSGAQRAEVAARVRNGTLDVRIRDDGVGGARPDGSGLVGLRDRVEALGGTLTIDSPDGRGTTLLAKLPLDNTAAAPDHAACERSG
jgi:signal transduction histidine kinase